jgi:hypothetical protein
MLIRDMHLSVSADGKRNAYRPKAQQHVPLSTYPLLLVLGQLITYLLSLVGKVLIYIDISRPHTTTNYATRSG